MKIPEMIKRLRKYGKDACYFLANNDLYDERLYGRDFNVYSRPIYPDFLKKVEKTHQEHLEVQELLVEILSEAHSGCYIEMSTIQKLERTIRKFEDDARNI